MEFHRGHQSACSSRDAYPAGWIDREHHNTKTDHFAGNWERSITSSRLILRAAFASPPVDVTLTTTSYTIPAAKSLDFGTNYWRVQSIDAAGNPSGWTLPRTFNVNIQKTPLNGSITTSKKPVFTWTAVPGAIRYRIQANKDTSELFTAEDLEINITHCHRRPPATHPAWKWITGYITGRYRSIPPPDGAVGQRLHPSP